MQWIAMILSFVFGRLNSKPSALRQTALEIFEDVSHHSRKVVALSMAGFASIVLFCGGIFISLLNMTMQYDQAGVITGSATLGAGLTLIVLSAGTFSYIFMTVWPGLRLRSSYLQRKQEAQQQAASSHAPHLEQALAALVMDFVKDREIKRGERPTPPPSSRQEKTSASDAHVH
ncbi:MAG: hypothetical protein AAGB31_11590 [Bdellovibrio sp.]